MTIKAIDNEWMVDVRPQGRNGPRVRRKFKTKSEAQQYERWVIATQNNKEWLGKDKKDPRTLEELIEAWSKFYGQSLKSGDKVKGDLLRICAEMGNPRASDLTKATFTKYRAARLDAGISPVTINREHDHLSGVFSALTKAGQYTAPNPLSHLPRLRTRDKEKTFLTSEQINILLNTLENSYYRLAVLALATGARYEEAAQLTISRVQHNKVTFTDTKNGRDRTVPIGPDVHKIITDKVKSGKLFPGVRYETFRATLKRLFDLPEGQATHVLRHTFASHFTMNGGNIITLQKLLGHASIKQTMVYAHLAPDYLNEVITLNPFIKRDVK